MKIALLPGDGIGPEITEATRTVLAAADRKHGLGFNFTEVAIGFAALKAEGVQTAVFSNKADAFCGKIIEHYFGPDSFSLVRGSRPGVPTKPAPAGVYSLMADLGADPQSTLFVGDSDVDILTGHNAGLPALGVLWGFRGEAELTAAGADALAAKPEDILAYLRREKH